jgi:hypothetical protein
MKLGIDVATLDKGRLIKRLNALKATIHACDGGAYREDPSISRVLLDTDWNEAQLDTWLYNSKGIDYYGTWVHKEAPRFMEAA